MILVLSFFVLIIALFVLGLFFSKIKLNIKKCNVEMYRNQIFEKAYEIELGLYLFGKFKFINIKFKDEKLKIMGKRMNYEKIKSSKILKKIMKKDFQELDKKEIVNNLKKLNLKFEKFNMDLNLGTDSTLVTSFLIFAVSTIVSLIIKRGVTKYNPNKYSFSITPRYENYNLLKIDFNCILSVKTLKFVKTIHYINKPEKSKKVDNGLIHKKKHYPGYV